MDVVTLANHFKLCVFSNLIALCVSVTACAFILWVCDDFFPTTSYLGAVIKLQFVLNEMYIFRWKLGVHIIQKLVIGLMATIKKSYEAVLRKQKKTLYKAKGLE